MPKELNSLWETLSQHFQQTNPQLPDSKILLLLFVMGLVLGLVPPVWRWTSYLITVVHEGGHAIAGLSVGRRLQGIKIRRDRSGETISSGGGFIPFRVWTTWWGYPAPAALGCMYLWASVEGWQNAAMTITFLLNIILFLSIRSFVAFLSISATVVTTGLLWWYAPPSVIAFLMYAVGWFLIIGGVKVLQELTVKHLRGDTEDSDATALARITFIIPGFVWLLTFWAATLVAFAFPLKSFFS